MICLYLFHDLFRNCSWFECRDAFPTNSQPSLPLLDVLAIFRWFFIDFLNSEGRSPEARRRSHAEVAGRSSGHVYRDSFRRPPEAVPLSFLCSLKCRLLENVLPAAARSNISKPVVARTGSAGSETRVMESFGKYRKSEVERKLLYLHRKLPL